MRIGIIPTNDYNLVLPVTRAQAVPGLRKILNLASRDVPVKTKLFRFDIFVAQCVDTTISIDASSPYLMQEVLPVFPSLLLVYCASVGPVYTQSSLYISTRTALTLRLIWRQRPGIVFACGCFLLPSPYL